MPLKQSKNIKTQIKENNYTHMQTINTQIYTQKHEQKDTQKMHKKHSQTYKITHTKNTKMQKKRR